MKHQFTLDLPSLDFSDVAFVSILTDTPDFALADDINHLYDIALCRVDDAQVDELSLPLYTFTDNLRHIACYLLSLPPAAEGFLLILRGSSALEMARTIESDFTNATEEPHPADVPAVRRHSILSRYQAALTLVSVVDFTADELDEASRPTRRTLRGRPMLADLFARILDYIDMARL